MNDQLIAVSVMGLGVAMIFASVAMPAFRMRKVGGIHFWKVGRIGGSFYVSKRG